MIKLRPISYLVLGMLRLGMKSGYAIKKAADAATSNVWPASLAQVYPELARLERHGLVTRRDDPHGARTRAAYELTEKGDAALLTWLRSPVETPFQIRSEGMLRLVFADALSPEDQLELVRRQKESFRNVKERIVNEGVGPVLEDLEAGQDSFPVMLAELGEGIYDFIVEQLTNWEAKQEAGRLSD